MNNSALWRLRIDLFAPDDGAFQVRFTEALKSRLSAFNNPRLLLAFGTDSGTGLLDGQRIVGSTFWIDSETLGSAAELGVGLVEESFHEACEGQFRLYDVVVLPSSALTTSVQEGFPPIPD
jgi:hypothetical protein